MDERALVHRLIPSTLPGLVRDYKAGPAALSVLASFIGISVPQLIKTHGHHVVARVLYEGALASCTGECKRKIYAVRVLSWVHSSCIMK